MSNDIGYCVHTNGNISPMKVFLIVRWPVGGIRTFINYIYSGWTLRDTSFDLISPNIPEVEILKNQLTDVNMRCHTVGSSSLGFTEFVKGVRKVLAAVEADLIHAHGFTSALSVAWKLPFLKCPSVVTSHDVLNKNQFLGIIGSIKRVVIPLLLNRFTIIHSVSYDAQNNLQEVFPLINKKKCQVILNGVDTERFYKAEPANLRKTMGISDDIVLIGFFGRFMSQKGFKYLVQAMSLLSKKFPGKYRVACFGSGGFIREERLALEELNLRETFFFHEFVADTAPYIKACDLVVMPSLWEACPLMPMEVLSAGIPLVASNCIGLREVCKGSPAIMVEPADAKSLAEGILKAEHQSLILSREYAVEAVDRYSKERAREEFQELYTNLVGPCQK